MATAVALSTVSPKLIAEMQQTVALAGQAQGRNICVFVGNTGSGKSTTINYLAGLTLRRYPHGIDVVPPEQALAKIGHGGSETKLTAIAPVDKGESKTEILRRLEGMSFIGNPSTCFDGIPYSPTTRLQIKTTMEQIGAEGIRLYDEYMLQNQKVNESALELEKVSQKIEGLRESLTKLGEVDVAVLSRAKDLISVEETQRSNSQTRMDRLKTERQEYTRTEKNRLVLSETFLAKLNLDISRVEAAIAQETMAIAECEKKIAHLTSMIQCTLGKIQKKEEINTEIHELKKKAEIQKTKNQIAKKARNAALYEIIAKKKDFQFLNDFLNLSQDPEIEGSSFIAPLRAIPECRMQFLLRDREIIRSSS